MSQIRIESTITAKVKIDNIDVPSVDAAICIYPTQDLVTLNVCLTSFLNGKEVNSNVGTIETAISNDTNVDPDLLIGSCESAIIALITSLNYNVTPL